MHHDTIFMQIVLIFNRFSQFITYNMASIYSSVFIRWRCYPVQCRESTAVFSIAAVIADEDYFLDGKITAIVYIICVV